MPASLNIAVLEDHDELRELTVAALKRHGHGAFGVYEAGALEELLVSQSIDLLVLDLNLPGEGGLSVASRLKAVRPGLFIIMVTARGTSEDRVAGYNHGADIYLPKPVSEQELIAAVSSLGRRLEQSRTGTSGEILTLNAAAQRLEGRAHVALGQTEVTLLKVLAQSPDQRAETYRLLEATHRGTDARAKASLEVQMVGLRKKIAAAGYELPAIRAMRNQGYQLLCQLRIE